MQFDGNAINNQSFFGKEFIIGRTFGHNQSQRDKSHLLSIGIGLTKYLCILLLISGKRILGARVYSVDQEKLK